MFDDEEREFQVVVNDEQQYSIWPGDRGVPAGWSAVGTRGVRAQCLDYIDRTWTDLRPASLRRAADSQSIEPVPNHARTVCDLIEHQISRRRIRTEPDRTGPCACLPGRNAHRPPVRTLAGGSRSVARLSYLMANP